MVECSLQKNRSKIIVIDKVTELSYFTETVIFLVDCKTKSFSKILICYERDKIRSYDFLYKIFDYLVGKIRERLYDLQIENISNLKRTYVKLKEKSKVCNGIRISQILTNIAV